MGGGCKRRWLSGQRGRDAPSGTPGRKDPNFRIRTYPYLVRLDTLDHASIPGRMATWERAASCGMRESMNFAISNLSSERCLHSSLHCSSRFLTVSTALYKSRLIDKTISVRDVQSMSPCLDEVEMKWRKEGRKVRTGIVFTMIARD